MPVSRSWLQRARRALTNHLDRLHETLVTLTERLREAVAQAVSNHLANAIREAVYALVPDNEPRRAPPSYYPASPYRPPSTWGEPDRSDREQDDDLPRADWSSEPSRGWREVEGEPPEVTTAQAGPTAASRSLERCLGGWLPGGGVVAAPASEPCVRGCGPRDWFAGHRCGVHRRHRVGRIHVELVEPGGRPPFRRPRPGLLVVNPWTRLTLP